MTNRGESQPLLIGLIGGPGAGKDTVAGLLEAHHDFIEVKFADPLREFVREIDPGWAIAESTVGYELAKARVGGFRERLVQVGEAARDCINPEVWLTAAARKARAFRACGNPVVVSDVRHDNEAEWIQDDGGFLVVVTRIGSPVEDYVEKIVIRADAEVMNDGNLIDLWAEVDAVLDWINDGAVV